MNFFKRRLFSGGNNSLSSQLEFALNYSSLPSVASGQGKFYWVSNSQGTWWLPGSLGGTYFPRGVYYSNGTSWEYAENPFQATQAEVDAGINNDKFVTPLTLKNSIYLRSIYNETPSGTINGTNKIFTTFSPYIANKTRLYLNGMRLKLIDDYTESGNSQITFVEAPFVEDKIIIDYN